MNESQLQFAKQLIKSLQFGLNSELSISEINIFLKEVINIEQLIIVEVGKEPFKRKLHYSLRFICSKAILIYNQNIDFETRVNCLEMCFKKGNLTFNDLKNWIRVLFRDFDNYLEINKNWFELVKLFLGTQKHKTQHQISKLVLQEFNINFRKINNTKRCVLLDKVLDNEKLVAETKKLILKHHSHISIFKRQLFIEKNLNYFLTEYELSKIIS